MRRPPKTNRLPAVAIVCEGLEDKLYLEALKGCGLWQNYRVDVLVAKGAGNIPAFYQNVMASDRYWAVLVFCDTDRNGGRDYPLISQKLRDILGCDPSPFVVFANPCSMQLMLLHFGEITLATQSKHANAPSIERLTGVKNYQAHEEQIREICGQIDRTNYQAMKARLAAHPDDDTVAGGTNFGKFLDCLENPDISWLKRLQKKGG